MAQYGRHAENDDRRTADSFHLVSFDDHASLRVANDDSREGLSFEIIICDDHSVGLVGRLDPYRRADEVAVLDPINEPVAELHSDVDGALHAQSAQHRAQDGIGTDPVPHLAGAVDHEVVELVAE